MLRVVRVLAAGNVHSAPIDSVIVAGDQRRVQTARMTGVNGTEIGMMLLEPVMLRMGDVFELDDGSCVDVVVEPDRLVEIRGDDLAHLARLAWHLGDRHAPVQVLNNRLRMRRDDVLESMLKQLGARLTAIDAPFDPEGGAYSTQPAHDHCGHDHHHHGHGHDDHDHVHGHRHHDHNDNH